MGDPAWLFVGEQHPVKCTEHGQSGGYAFKVILVGEMGVGKTSIFTRAQQPHREHVNLNPSSSIGIDFCVRTFHTSKGKVTLTLWDTAGGEQYRTLTRNYYRNTDAVLLVFSLHDPSSLFSLPQWQCEVTSISPEAVPFLVGNKSDTTRKVKEQSMKTFAGAHHCQAAFLTSARTGEGVETALQKMCEHLVDLSHQQSTMHSKDQLWKQGSGLHVHGCEGNKEETKKCC